MKKILFTLTIMLTTLSASGMSYEQAREQALFLTDKMAYELDLTEEQYEAAFEVNLDYLMSVNTTSDLYSDYWTRRNLDLSYILFDWQYRTFCGLDYFYRPLYWGDGFWHFRIFSYYPHRDYFYYGRPAFYFSYRGGHAWHMNGGRSWYNGRHFERRDYGMRGGWDRGHYRNISRGWRPNDGGNRGIAPRTNGRGFRNNGGRTSPSRGFRPDAGRNGGDRGSVGRPDGSNFRAGSSRDPGTGGFRIGGEGTQRSSTRQTVGGHSRESGTGYTPSRSFGGGVNRTPGEGTRPTRSFGGGTSSSTPSRSFSGGSSPSRSFGGTRSSGGGSNGGGHFGGGRR